MAGITNKWLIDELKKRNIDLLTIICEKLTNSGDAIKKSIKKHIKLVIDPVKGEVSIIDTGRGMHKKGAEEFWGKGKSNKQSLVNDLIDRGFFGDGAKISQFAARITFETKSFDSNAVTSSLDIRNKLEDYYEESTNNIVKELSKEQELNLIKKLDNSTGTIITLSNFSSGFKDQLKDKKYVQKLISTLTKAFYIRHLLENQEIIISAIIDGEEKVLTKHPEKELIKGTEETIDIPQKQFLTSDVMKVLKENNISVDNLLPTTLAIGQVKVEESEFYDDDEITRDYGVTLLGRYEDQNEYVANFIGPNSNNLESLENIEFTRRFKGLLSMDLRLLKACQHSSKSSDNNFIDMNRRGFGKGKNKISNNLLKIAGKEIKKRVDELKEKELENVALTRTNTSSLGREWAKVDKDYSGEITPRPSRDPILDIEARPSKLNVEKGKTAYIQLLINNNIISNSINGNLIRLEQMKSSNDEIADIARFSEVEGIKTPFKYYSIKESDRYDGYGVINLKVEGKEYGDCVLNVNFEQKNGDKRSIDIAIEVTNKTVKNIEDNELKFLNGSATVQPNKRKKIILAAGIELYDEFPIHKNIKLNIEGKDIKILDKTLKKIKEPWDFDEHMAGNDGCYFVEIELEAGPEFNNGIISASLETLNIVTAVNNISKFTLSDTCTLSTSESYLDPVVIIIDKQTSEKSKKYKELAKKVDTLFTPGVNSKEEKTADKFEILAENKFFDDKLLNDKDGKIIISESSEFYDAAAVQMAWYKGLYKSRQKLNRESEGDLSKISEPQQFLTQTQSFQDYYNGAKNWADIQKNGK